MSREIRRLIIYRLGSFNPERGTAESSYVLTQFSILSFGTRLNSLSLWVTRMLSIDKACAAISISRDPMGVPFFSRYDLRLP